MSPGLALHSLDGNGISREIAGILYDRADSFQEELLELGRRVRLKFTGINTETCSIINARSGKCSEDCKFCAQSVWYRSPITEYPLLDYETILQKAIDMDRAGVKRFSIVISGKKPSKGDFEKILRIIEKLRRETNLQLCASLGIIDRSMAEELKAAGLSMYHHNLETSRGYFRQICTTHSYEDRIKTVESAREAGLTVCSGGIIGLGETFYERIEMIYELKSMEVDSIPVNILNPRPGTPLEKMKPPSSDEIIRTLVIFRLISPGATFRLCGGREPALGDRQELALEVAVNGLMVGGYLTTEGDPLEKDMAMIGRVKDRLAELQADMGRQGFFR
ncbi:biotin synthase BioB [Thermodesulforhabdus norvegica]|uniref:Biotin synthase n=1 Tax=Thermodesulforhabdus norvegica TaxID=39841 RepID=A0A1I4SMI8_9BACT|nr:biotin synthase BioB [Thermodesulforhabdus norvegica]SFM65738.1 biotin synthase [Thermodesulforhabdus norvegica]